MNYKINDYEIIYMIREHNIEEEFLYKKYEPMIKSEINRYRKAIKLAGFDEMDIYQEGMLGLADALKYYDESHGSQFSTYAFKCIHGKILNCIRKSMRKKRGLYIEKYSLSKELPSGLKIEDLLASAHNVESDFNFENLKQEMIRFKHDLPLTHSFVFELKINGFNSEEISVLLEISSRTVSNYWHIAKKELKQTLSI